MFNIEYENVEDLKLEIFDLCELLKKDFLLFQIFMQDTINEQFKSECKKVFNYKCYNIYMSENANVLNKIDFENLRFLNIYGLEGQFSSVDFIGYDKMIKNYSFCLGFDNYLDYAKASINFARYDNSIVSKLQRKIKI